VRFRKNTKVVHRREQQSTLTVMMLKRAAMVLLPLVFLGLASCGDSGSKDDGTDGDGDDDEHEDVGTPTGATCPSTDPPTYENFGRDFLESYCTGCHSSALSGTARKGAPPDHNFDTHAGVIEYAEHIDGVAASGPEATNTTMPLLAPMPSLEERERLGEWLACEIAAASK
jgi:hypothetical protein